MNYFFTVAISVGGCVYIYFLFRVIHGLHLLGRSNHTQKPYEPKFVSVVIAARNEEKEINRTLTAVISQRYPNDLLEIIVVDDRSTDATSEIVSRASHDDPRVRLMRQTEVHNGVSPKKQALSLGIRSARGELIVTTDADCRPDPLWVSRLVAHFEEGVSMVAGQARFDTGEKPPLWQRLQALDFQSQGVSAAGLIADDFPFNCTGASLAFSRKLFEDIDGYSGVDNLISGDDELLMAKAWRSNLKIAAAVGKEIVVPTRTAASLRELWNQRIRWGSKGMYYQSSRKWILIGVFIFLLSLAFAPVMFIATGQWFPWLWWSAIKIVLDFTAMHMGSRLFEESFSFIDFISLEIIHAPALVLFAVAGHLTSFEWKGQKFRTKG